MILTKNLKTSSARRVLSNSYLTQSNLKAGHKRIWHTFVNWISHIRMTMRLPKTCLLMVSTSQMGRQQNLELWIKILTRQFPQQLSLVSCSSTLSKTKVAKKSIWRSSNCKKRQKLRGLTTKIWRNNSFAVKSEILWGKNSTTCIEMPNKLTLL